MDKNKISKSLLEECPELAAEWHPTKNGKLKPEDVTCGSNKTVWWYLSYDDPETGKHFQFEWLASVSNRVKGKGCPYLSGKAVWPGFNDLATKNPELAREWHPTKNRKLKPSDVTCRSTKKVWWVCDDCNNSWRTSICSRAVKGTGCPKCIKYGK